jgi:hypothetical protein
MRDPVSNSLKQEILKSVGQQVKSDQVKNQHSTSNTDLINQPLVLDDFDDDVDERPATTASIKSTTSTSSAAHVTKHSSKSKTSIQRVIREKTHTAPAKSYNITEDGDQSSSDRGSYETRLLQMLQKEGGSSVAASVDSVKDTKTRGRSSTASSSNTQKSTTSLKRLLSGGRNTQSAASNTGNNNNNATGSPINTEKSLKEKYLGFLRFSRKNNDKLSESRDFMPGSNADSISDLEEASNPVPDPVILLERLSKAMESCKWKSPVLSDELCIVDVLFDSDYRKAFNLIKGISELSLNSVTSNAQMHSNTISRTTSFSSSSMSFYSAVESRRGTLPSSAQAPNTFVNPTPTPPTSVMASHASVNDFVDALSTTATATATDLNESINPGGRSVKARAPLLPKKRVNNPIQPGFDPKRNALHKFNSCSTLFTIDSTVYTPPSKPEHLDVTIRAVAHAIHTHLTRTTVLYQELLAFDQQQNNIHTQTNYARKLYKSAEFLSEKLYPIWKVRRIPDEVLTNPEIMHPPTYDELFQFIKQIIVAADLSAEIAIITLIYLERMMVKTKTMLFGVNCFRAILGALMLASKVWDDQAVWNVDFKTIMCDLALEDLNSLERWWLKQVKFDVNIKRGVFAKYWFEVREVAEKVWGIQLGKSRIIGYNSDGNGRRSDDINVSTVFEGGASNLMAPALLHGEEAQRRKSRHELDVVMLKPLTEDHIKKLSGSTTQTKIRSTFLTAPPADGSQKKEKAFFPWTSTAAGGNGGVASKKMASDKYWGREKVKTSVVVTNNNNPDVKHYE